MIAHKASIFPNTSFSQASLQMTMTEGKNI